MGGKAPFRKATSRLQRFSASEIYYNLYKMVCQEKNRGFFQDYVIFYGLTGTTNIGEGQSRGERGRAGAEASEKRPERCIAVRRERYFTLSNLIELKACDIFSRPILSYSTFLLKKPAFEGGISPRLQKKKGNSS